MRSAHSTSLPGFTASISRSRASRAETGDRKAHRGALKDYALTHFCPIDPAASEAEKVAAQQLNLVAHDVGETLVGVHRPAPSKLASGMSRAEFEAYNAALTNPYTKFVEDDAVVNHLMSFQNTWKPTANTSTRDHPALATGALADLQYGFGRTGRALLNTLRGAMDEGATVPIPVSVLQRQQANARAY